MRRATTSVADGAGFLWRGLLDLALPRVCVRCAALLGDANGMVCAACWADVRVLPRPRCDRCGHPTHGACDGACAWCALLPAGVSSARSLCWVPEGAGGDLVHKLKYGGWPALAADLAARMSRTCKPPACGGATVLVPVPLGSRRRRERGYNQSAALAHALGRLWRAPVTPDVLVRRRETTSQVLLTPEERSANVHGAFAAGIAARAVRDAHVVLVDDVVTTAATLNACAPVLVAARAATISYVTFGRARAAFDRTTHHRST